MKLEYFSIIVLRYSIIYLLSNIKIYIYIDYNIAKIKNLFDLY